MTALRVWAPDVSRLAVVVDGQSTPLEPDGDGWWTGPELAPGTDYAFQLDDARRAGARPGLALAARRRARPEPGLRPAAHTAWQDTDWAGRDLPGAVIYELHISTFTEGGTFDSAIERLDHLVDLGITHVEVLPINAVNGTWNWGYDGVGWYAVHEPLGGPDGFKRFVDAAHARGLAVVLDVVYNHFGPSGNYLPRFGPYLKTGRNTWGDLVNVEEPAVRNFIIENALMWLRDYHVDGLRLDAVHALQDSSPQHILAELAERTEALQAEVGRPLTLIAESDLNDPIMVEPRPHGYGLDGVWDDDVHHALHFDAHRRDAGLLLRLRLAGRAAEGAHRRVPPRRHVLDVPREGARPRRSTARTTPGYRFVVALQNHDQVGNRAVGDRLPELTSPGLVRVGAVLLLTAPFTPMLWMGEEWAASTRWPFFTSHPEPELAEATAKGRVEEFGRHGWDVTQMIDPQDPAAYRSAILRWDESGRPRAIARCSTCTGTSSHCARPNRSSPTPT